MIPDNKHKDIPGNPSTAKSSIQKLRISDFQGFFNLKVKVDNN